MIDPQEQKRSLADLILEMRDKQRELEASLLAARQHCEKLGQAFGQVRQASRFLKEASRVMKADNLHRGNPARRDLWERISKFRKEIDKERG